MQTNAAANLLHLTTIDGLNAMLDATQGERPAIEAPASVETTEAQNIVLVDAVTPKPTSGLMVWTRGDISYHRPGIKSVLKALAGKGLAVCATDERGDTFYELTPAGLAKADALAAVFSYVGPCMANKFRGALVAK